MNFCGIGYLLILPNPYSATALKRKNKRANKCSYISWHP